MNTIKLAQTNVGILTDWLREHVVQFTAVRTAQNESELRSLSVAQVDGRDAMRVEQLFAQAVQDNSNLEFDWLWCAANMTSIANQRYCLLRALEINPDSKLAQRALAKLPQDAVAEAVASAALSNA